MLSQYSLSVFHWFTKCCVNMIIDHLKSLKYNLLVSIDNCPDLQLLVDYTQLLITDKLAVNTT